MIARDPRAARARRAARASRIARSSATSAGGCVATRDRAALRAAAHAPTRAAAPSRRDAQPPDDQVRRWPPYESVDELIEPLPLCYRSLVETGQQIIADGRLADLLRRAATFGLTLVRLDVRQHAARHAAALDAITRQRGLGSYAEWPEERRARRSSPKALADPDAGRIAATCRTPTTRCATCSRRSATIAELHPESLGAYVDLDGPGAVGRARRGLAPAPRRRVAADRAAVRTGRRLQRRGGDAARLAGHPGVPRPDRRSAGSDGRLLRLRQGRRPAGGELGALHARRSSSSRSAREAGRRS